MKYLVLLFFLNCVVLCAQVGINTTSPNAALDIQATNAAAPSATDGILIPKIDEFPATNPTAAQDGMMVFVTGNGSVSKGFYYWDQTTTNWQTISGAVDHDWYQLPSDTPADTITDNLYTLGKVKIGTQTNYNYQLHLLDTITSNLTAFKIEKKNLENSVSRQLYGIQSEVSDSLAGVKTAGVFVVSGPVSNAKYGIRSLISVDTLGGVLKRHYGTYNSFFGDAYRQYEYGVYNDLNTTNQAWDRTGMVNVLGAGGSIFEETGVRNVINSGNGRQFGVQNQLTTVSEWQRGTVNFLTANGSGWQYASQNTLNQTGNGRQHGNSNNLHTTGGGWQYGNSNNLHTTGGGWQYGTQNTLTKSSGSGGRQYGIANLITSEGSTTRVYGSYNLIQGSGGSSVFPKYGTYNDIRHTGPADKYASYSHIPDTIPGVHYGYYSDVRKSDSYAGYFLGRVAIGETGPTNYILPTTRGTADQVLQTDGAGGTSWVDPTSIGVEGINDLTDGKSDNDGTNNGSSLFVGEGAGTNDDSSNNQNVGIGYFSLNFNTIGSQNTSIGNSSMYRNINGVLNTAMGSSAMQFNSSGTGNTAIGANSLFFNTLGNTNIALGSSSLLGNVSGNDNIGIGPSALTNNQTGNRNIAIGNQSGSIQTDLSDNISIGNNAGNSETNSNRLYIENSASTTPLIYGEFDNDILGVNGSLGVGTQAPGAPLHIINEGTSGVQNIVATLGSNTSNRPVLQFSETATSALTEGMSLEYDGRGSGGANRMVFNSVGGDPLFEFRNGGDLTLRDGDLIVRGSATDREIKLDDDAGNSDRVLMRQTGTQDIYVGDIDNNGGDLYLRAGGSTELTILDTSGFVGINTLTPSYTLEVNGTAAKPGGGSWINSSDRRLKKNIQPYANGIETILKINPVSYQYNQLSGFDETKTHVGVIAQELQEAAPSMVTSYVKEERQFLAVDNSEMTYMLINAVKEQQKQIEELKKEIQLLKSTKN